MRTLRLANNIAEIIENGMVIIRINRLDASQEQMVQQMVSSGEYQVETFDVNASMDDKPADFDWTQSIIAPL